MSGSIMPTSPWLRGTARIVRYLARSLAYGAVAAAAIVCLTLLALRFYVFPRIEDYRPQIASVLSRAVGNEVAIAGVSPAWDGWNPRLVLAGVTVREPGGPTLLELPVVDGVVSWRWMLLGRLRLKALTLDEPRLVVRRDPQGRIVVAGATIEPDRAEQDTGVGAWLLEQRLVVVRNGAVSWIDEQRRAPPLELEQVEFRLENGLGRHRFGLTGAPPARLASPLDVRGDIRGDPLVSWQALRGRLYVRLDYADLAAWRPWLPLPVDVAGGRGGVRLWLDLPGAGNATVTGDFDLADVRIPVGAEPRMVALTRVSGRLGSRARPGGSELFAENLALALAGGARITPTSATLLLADGATPALRRAEARFAAIDLAAAADIASAIGAPAEWRERIAAASPRGTLEDADLRWEAPAKGPPGFTVKARFRDLAARATGALPAIAGARGSFEATDKGGSMQASAGEVRLELPAVLTEPLRFDTAEARASWDFSRGALAVRLHQLSAANTDAAGTLSGEWRAESDGPGWVDLQGQLTRADARQVHRYLPRGVNPSVRDWVRRALRAGQSNDTRLRLKGRLAEFPFRSGNGEFVVAIRGDSATLHFADAWPEIEGIRADVVFERAAMRITGHEGRVLGAGVAHAEVSIPDLYASPPHLLVSGEASGATREFVRFIDASPVAGWLDRFTDGVEAEGAGSLSLKLDIPLGNERATAVSGEYTFAANRLRVGDEAPVLDKVSGKLSFTASDVRGRGLSAEILGGPATIDFARLDDRVRVSAAGNAELAAAMKRYSLPGTERVSGRTDWAITVDTGRAARWDLSMPLKGVAIDLPPPFGKPPEATLPLRVERRSTGAGRETIVATVAGAERTAARVGIVRAAGRGGEDIESVVVALGDARPEPRGSGLWVVGRTGDLDADRWLALWRGSSASEARSPAGIAGPLDLAGIDIAASTATLLGSRLHDFELRAMPGRSWRIDIGSREIAGRVEWQPSPEGDRVVARLARLDFGAGSSEAAAPGRLAAVSRIDGNPADWPLVDLVAEQLLSRGRDLGRLELRGAPRRDDWRIERLRLSNAEGGLAAEGWWRGGKAPRTEVGVVLDVNDASAFLRRFGYPDAVRGARTTLKGDLVWPGSPRAFEPRSLSGAFSIETQSGQFTRLNPGIGKLLGVLNLQALPRRMTLDFRDVFSEGFVFDALTGTVRITDGVMTTSDLRFAGPGARVEIAGEANLVDETQRLVVRVQPSLSSSIAIGAAIGLANPAAGAAVLLGQKLLQDPVEKMFTTEYRITGHWADPQVARSPIFGAAASPATGASEARQ